MLARPMRPRFDKFNLKYNPFGQSRLREIFIKQVCVLQAASVGALAAITSSAAPLQQFFASFVLPPLRTT
jgi:hypothetical protein